MSKKDKIVTEINIYQPRERLIRQCEKLLEWAKSGELVGHMDICLWHGGGVSHGLSIKNSDYIRTMIGELEILKHDIIDWERHQDGTAESY